MMLPRTDAVRIVEVGPRDGLQNISKTIPTDLKLELIKRLQDCGLQTIELTSVVSPKAIPQLADCRKVLSDSFVQSQLTRNDLRLPVLIPNLKGLEVAAAQNVKEIAVFVSASEGFSKANINCSVQQGLNRAKEVTSRARELGMSVRGYVISYHGLIGPLNLGLTFNRYISCIFICPYDGPVQPAAVFHCVKQLLEMGCYEVSLGDTTGVGTASNVRKLLSYLVSNGVELSKLAGHFHDTYGQAVSNVWAAYQMGVRVFDSSVAGLGGCPYAPGAKGNVATEDLVYTFHQSGVETGVDLDKLARTGVWISQTLSRENSSRAGMAIFTKSEQENKKSKLTKPLIDWVPDFSLTKGSDLEIYRSGRNLKVVLNRPKNGNALTVTMISELTNIFSQAATEHPAISRIIITSRGKFFCTGMDLSKASSPVARGGSTTDAQSDRLTKLFEAIDNAPQVTIAAVQGAAFGGGVGLAFCCDVRILSSNASFRLSEVRLGLSPATISKYVVREWGVPFSREAMLSGRTISPTELSRLGTVARVVDGDENALVASLDQYLLMLKHSAPRASTMCKELVRLGWVAPGQTKQSVGIRDLFTEMMSPDAEASYGLQQFQKGVRDIDWDEYVQRKARQESAVKSKL